MLDRYRGGVRVRRLCVAGAVIAATTFGVAPAHATTTTAMVSSVTAQLAAPVVAMAATPSGAGYWRASADGGVLTAGDAHFYGSAVGKPHDVIIAMAATRTGHGYWLVDRKGAVFAFGDAPFKGSMAGHPLNLPIVGMAATPTSTGYWLVASDGGIFAFNAPFRGSTGGMRLNLPIVGMAATPTGSGYWLVAGDGGIFAFNAVFKGSTGSIHLNQPIVGIAAVPNGSGYSMVAKDGGLFRFPSTTPFYGSAVNACPGAPAIGLAMSPGAIGYWIGFGDGRTYAFSPTAKPPTCGPTGASKTAIMAADLFSRLNSERAARGLPPLAWDPTLATYATAWSATMATHGFAHSNIGVFLGPYNYLGENIAAGSKGVPDGALHVAWMNSTGHRENILAPGFTRVGVGVFCAADGGIWLTEDFGRAAGQGAPPMTNLVPPVDPIARPEPGTMC